MNEMQRGGMIEHGHIARPRLPAVEDEEIRVAAGVHPDHVGGDAADEHACPAGIAHLGGAGFRLHGEAGLGEQVGLRRSSRRFPTRLHWNRC